MSSLGRFDDAPRFSDLLGLAYDAAASPALWPDFLARTGETLEMQVVNLSISQTDPAGDIVALPATWGGRDNTVNDYVEHFGQLDRHRIAARTRPPGVIGPCERLVPDDDFTRGEYFHDFYLPNGMRHGISSVLHNDSSGLSGISMHRGPHRPPPGIEELHFLEMITPHLMRVRQLSASIGTLKSQQRVTAEVLDRMSVGLVFVDRHGVIQNANARAEAILSENDGLTARNQLLAADLPRESRALSAAVAVACETGLRRSSDVPASVRISRPSGQRSFDVMACPVDVESRMWAEGSATAFIVISDGRAQVEGAAARMQTLYGLTSTEAKLAVSLANGTTVKRWAEERGTSTETARWQLKQVYSKTETNGQTDLIRLVLLGPALAR